MTDKHKECLEYLMRLLGASDDKLYSYVLLFDAIEYANLDDYYHQPKTRYEAVMREIFLVKAKCYWNRKLILYSKERQKTGSKQTHSSKGNVYLLGGHEKKENYPFKNC